MMQLRKKPAHYYDPELQHGSYGIYKWFKSKNNNGRINRDTINEIFDAYFLRYYNGKVFSDRKKIELIQNTFTRFAAFASIELKKQNTPMNTQQQLTPVQYVDPSALPDAPIETLAVTLSQKNWVILHDLRAATDKELAAIELELQGLLLNPGTTITERETTRGTYKKTFDRMVERRKEFTNLVNEKIIAPRMDFEKRADPSKNQKFIEFENALKTDKQKEDARALFATGKENEKTRLHAHAINENTRIAADYRARCINELNAVYYDLLKERTHADCVKEAIEMVKTTLQEFQLQTPLPFDWGMGYNPDTDQREYYLKQEDVDAVYTRVQPLDFAALQKEMFDQVEEKFSMYANDLIATPDVETLKQETAAEVTAIQDQAAISAGVTNLQASAAVVEYTAPGKKLKYVLLPVINNSLEWVAQVLPVFVSHINVCKVGVKNYEKLTVEQMAKAIAVYIGNNPSKGKWDDAAKTMTYMGLVFKEETKL